MIYDFVPSSRDFEKITFLQDNESVQSALDNILENNLQSQVTIRPVSEASTIFDKVKSSVSLRVFEIVLTRFSFPKMVRSNSLCVTLRSFLRWKVQV